MCCEDGSSFNRHLEMKTGHPGSIDRSGIFFWAMLLLDETTAISNGSTAVMKPLTATTIVLAIVLATQAAPCRGQSVGPPEKIAKPVDQAISIRQATQKQEEKWRLEKEKLTARFELLGQRLRRLRARAGQLRERSEAAKTRIAAKQKQLDDIRQISAQIVPCLKELNRQLKQLVAGDLPFLLRERRERLRRLDALLQDPDVTASEKFRKVTEALQVEAEYGTTIEVYQQSIDIDGRNRLVNIFRLGRIGLFFQSLDRRTCGFFNVAENSWQKLPPKYNHSLAAAIDMGARRRPVDIVTLPLGRLATP